MQDFSLPPFVDLQKADQLWRVDYEACAADAKAWAARHALEPASAAQKRIALFLVDVQNTFALPGFELYVAGRSGTGAVDDSRRLAAFMYRNLAHISKISLTMDTHRTMQIFHAAFLVDADNQHPPAYTMVTVADLEAGRWRFNPALAPEFGITPEVGQARILHYAKELARKGKYTWTIWPYHAMLGGIGHAIVPLIEEAVFFHSVARSTQPEILEKGAAPFSERYSALSAEVLRGPDGERLGEQDMALVDHLRDVDALIVAGQAKSHCVAATVEDLLINLRKVDPALAQKIYLLEDCTSPVVVPGADFTDAGNAAFAKFAEAGMHLVQSTQPMQTWGEIFE